MDYEYALACAIVPLVLYCLPLCFYRYLIRGYSLSKKYAIITVLIYGFVFSLAFSLIMSAITDITVTPASTSFTAFYGLISYFLLTRGGSHKQTGNDSKTPVNPVEAKNDISASVVEDAERAEECPQGDNKSSVTPEETNTIDPLPEKSRTFEKEDKPAAEEHKTLTLKAPSSDKEKVLLNIKVPSAKVLRILNIVIIIVLTVAVIALSIAFPRALKKVNKSAYDRGYNDGYNIGYAQGEYHQKYFGTSQSYQSDSNIQSTDEEHSETIDERIARVQREYGN